MALQLRQPKHAPARESRSPEYAPAHEPCASKRAPARESRSPEPAARLEAQRAARELAYADCATTGGRPPEDCRAPVKAALFVRWRAGGP